ncbi:MAG: nucleotidyltransferase domain-containing protein [Candidatus Rokubacteria bacterium]|nr:nucleotidyltransferase domain-containing protein [Candidatus Rokubacteria bacterium]
MAHAIIQDLDMLKARLAPHLRRARKAIVFGSVARGEADEWSDLDLLVVASTARPFLERYLDLEGIYDVWPRLDLLVYTPEEFEEMAVQGRLFLAHVLSEGVVIHEAAAES